MSALPAQLPTVWLAWMSAAFIIKHLLGDFILQNAWIAKGKERPTGWFLPLFVHATIHAALTAIICLVAAPGLLWLAAVDFVVHFSIDRVKSLIGIAYRLEPRKTAFWWLIGTDQSLHHLTHLGYVLAIAALHMPQI